MPIVNKSDHF